MKQPDYSIPVSTIAPALRRCGADDEADQLERLVRSGRLPMALASTSNMSLYELARAALVAASLLSPREERLQFQVALRCLEQLGVAADEALRAQLRGAA